MRSQAMAYKVGKCKLIHYGVLMILAIYYNDKTLTDMCPSSTRLQIPLPRSQTRILLSSDPEARRPSGSTAREVTAYSIIGMRGSIYKQVHSRLSIGSEYIIK